MKLIANANSLLFSWPILTFEVSSCDATDKGLFSTSSRLSVMMPVCPAHGFQYCNLKLKTIIKTKHVHRISQIA